MTIKYQNDPRAPGYGRPVPPIDCALCSEIEKTGDACGKCHKHADGSSSCGEVHTWPLDDLRFSELRAANVARLPEFKNSRGLPAHTVSDGSDWSPLEWGGATAGEIGELCNYLKKLRRGDVTLETMDQKEQCTIRQAIAREIADSICYLDHVANQLGIDVGEAVREKFNRVSDAIGCKVKL